VGVQVPPPTRRTHAPTHPPTPTTTGLDGCQQVGDLPVQLRQLDREARLSCGDRIVSLVRGQPLRTYGDSVDFTSSKSNAVSLRVT
jgi:hypothetical protein